MTVRSLLAHTAPAPARGSYADGWQRVAQVFAMQIERGEEVGAGLVIYHRGERVVDLWGGHADAATGRPWEADTRLVLFSVTKGLAAMALHLLADRGMLDWDAPVSTYWPEFGTRGKEGMTVRTLVNHQGGLACLDTRLTLDDCLDPKKAKKVRRALEAQRPVWTPGEGQGYHAITYGLYVGELFRRIVGEELGPWIRRELFEPLGSDVWIGAPAHLDAKVATLVAPPVAGRVARMIHAGIRATDTTEGRVARSILGRGSLPRRAFSNPSTPGGPAAYNSTAVRRASLAWASASGSADGVARAYLPFASEGHADGRTYFRPETIRPAYARQSWSENDGVLQKPLGWSQGFLKEERHLFSPHAESFGHSGMGGALGWCDPVDELTFGYVMNRMDWRVRSLRCLALCRATYECEALLGSR